jgi:hypothetical protein
MASFKQQNGSFTHTSVGSENARSDGVSFAISSDQTPESVDAERTPTPLIYLLCGQTARYVVS